MNKRYYWDTLYADVSREPQYTEWIAVINESGHPYKATPYIYATPSIEKKFIMRRPEEFEGVYPACKMESAHKDSECQKTATYIPFLSTEKGWKWNRRQMLSLLQKYPNVSRHVLDNYLTNPYLQIRLKKVMGKHFRAFVREIKGLLPDVHITHITNFTERKVSREVFTYNVQLMYSFLRIMRYSVYGATGNQPSYEDFLQA